MPEAERRAHRRQRILGRAHWRAGRLDGVCALLDISIAGAEISQPNMLLTVGRRLELRLDLGAGPLPVVHAIVVRNEKGNAAFRFLRQTPMFLEALSAALTPPDAGG